MKITEKQRRTVEELAAIQCDKCGKLIDKREDIYEFQEILSVSFTGGYGAILGDGDRYELDLCQHCVKEVLGPYLRPQQEASSHRASGEKALKPFKG